MAKQLKHYGVLGMHWGVTNNSGGARAHFKRSVNQKYGKIKNPIVSKEHFYKSLEQKYGHSSVKDFLSSVGHNAAVAATAFVGTYSAIVVTNFVVDSIPKIAWATGKIISNNPLH